MHYIGTPRAEVPSVPGEPSERSRSDRDVGFPGQPSDVTFDDASTIFDFMESDSAGDDLGPSTATESRQRASPKRRVAALHASCEVLMPTRDECRVCSCRDILHEHVMSQEMSDFPEWRVAVMKKSLQGVAYFGTSYFCMFLEVCSGTAILTQAVRYCGLTTLEPIDIINGWDLTNKSTCRKLKAYIAAKRPLYLSLIHI